MLTLVLIIIAIALVFDFFNGFNDAANSIATVVATRVLTPAQAVVWAAFWNFAAAFLFGTAVAGTISASLVNISALGTPHEQLYVVLSGLIGATVWTAATSFMGMPISVSHALISGYAGAAIARAGVAGLMLPGKWPQVIAFIFLSPVIGMFLGGILMIATAWIFRNATPSRVDAKFKRMQLFSAAAFSLSHGTNDAQKTMGIIVVVLTAAGWSDLAGAGWAPPWFGWFGMHHGVAWWIVLLCHSVIALGTMLGGWKVVRTMGAKITRLQPVGGFCAETAGAGTVIASSLMGIPVSTTHVITGSILGVGMTRGWKAVNWASGKKIMITWIVTLPCTAFMSAIIYLIVHGILVAVE